MSKKTVSFGEVLLRLSPPGFERLMQSPSLSVSFGGGEANVAVALARFGLDSHLVSRLPDNAVGDAALRAYRAEGVNVDAVSRGGERIGIYFAETGASQRPSLVVYDRAHSAMTELEPDGVPWSEVLRGASWFHTSGITPAIGARAAECTRTALAAARRAGARVSFDLNYRSTLWTKEEAQRVIRPLIHHAHVLIANEQHLTHVLGIRIERTDEISIPHVEALRAGAERVVAEFGVEQVAITLRESLSGSENASSAIFYDSASRTLYRGPRYVVRLVDRIGGGDALAAGLIFALLDGRAPADALRFAVAAGALKQTIVGDFNRVSVAEVECLAAGDESGRVRR
jgi:2-dehydro-3-deoxygluconokinase